MEKSARKIGIKVIVNDGSKTIDELAVMVKEHFGLLNERINA